MKNVQYRWTPRGSKSTRCSGGRSSRSALPAGGGSDASATSLSLLHSGLSSNAPPPRLSTSTDNDDDDSGGGMTLTNDTGHLASRCSGIRGDHDKLLHLSILPDRRLQIRLDTRRRGGEGMRATREDAQAERINDDQDIGRDRDAAAASSVMVVDNSHQSAQGGRD